MSAMNLALVRTAMIFWAFRLEAEERRFETRPLFLDCAPGESGRENPLCHVRQQPIVLHSRERRCAFDLRQERHERSVAALSFGCPCPDGGEMLHGNLVALHLI